MGVGGGAGLAGGGVLWNSWLLNTFNCAFPLAL